MPKRLLIPALSILAIAAALLVIDAVLALAYWYITGPESPYLPALSNLLFLEGAVLMAAGAFTEFFHVGSTRGIGRTLRSPGALIAELFGKNCSNKSRDQPEMPVWWTLVFLGGALIALSAAVLLISVK